MKKILFLLPFLGICSSLFAQAPQVQNVNAQQIEGTKDVDISFDISSRPGGATLNLEVWFKEGESSSSWMKVRNVIDPLTGTPLPGNITVDEFGVETCHSLRIDGVTETLSNRSLMWQAGVDAPDVNTQDARIKLIAFYEKIDETTGTISPNDQQVSGFNGVDESGFSNPQEDSNGTAGGDNNGTSGATYVRDYSDANNYPLSFDPAVNFEDAQYGSAQNKMDTIMQGFASLGSYYDDAGGVFYNVYELYDSFLYSNTGTNPPSGMGTFAVVGVSFIPVTLTAQ